MVGHDLGPTVPVEVSHGEEIALGHFGDHVGGCPGAGKGCRNVVAGAGAVAVPACVISPAKVAIVTDAVGVGVAGRIILSCSLLDSTGPILGRPSRV